LANAYTTTDAVIAALDPSQQGLFPSTDSNLASYLTSCITRASRLIDKYTSREEGAYAVTTDTEIRYFDGSGQAIQWVNEMCAVPTLVEVAEGAQVDHEGTTDGNYTTYGSTGWWLLPQNASQKRIPYHALELDSRANRSYWYPYRRGIRITARWGYAAATTDSITPIPEIEQATIVQAARLFQRGRQGYEDVGAIEALSQLRYVKSLDPDVAEIVKHFKYVVV